MFNVDNITNEHVPFIIEKLMKKGAKNVHVVPSITKKGRQEHIFYVDLPESKVEAVSSEIVRETGSIGMRIIKEEHISYDYEFKKVKVDIDSENYAIKVKLILDEKGEYLSAKAEHEDIRLIANQINSYSFSELKTLIESEIIKKITKKDISINIL
ncbi:MAG: nickel insertion protein [Halanaerobiales bacterium]|nr:nickel insertion protein [Halanaerobiales bacterium]